MSSPMHKLAVSALTAALTLAACGDQTTIIPDATLVERAPASTDACPSGGVRITTGADANGDGLLQDAEVTDEAVVCDGAPGNPGSEGQDGLQTLVSRADEPAGANCENGGERVDVGLDDDRDGTLAAAEIDATTYVCAGRPGENAPALLTETSTSVGADCQGRTGTRVRAGLDDDRDGVLDESEVDTSRVVCTGEDGETQLVVVDSVAPGADCLAGGRRVRSGLDQNGDGLLQEAEVLDADFICDPIAVLTETTPVNAGSADCPFGGQRIDVGADADGSGSLDASEVTSTTFACNGEDGVRVLTARADEPAGANCASGGERIAVGLDLDRDGALDPSEEQSVNYACDGAAGSPGANGGAVRVDPEPAGANCANGGLRVQNGADADGDGVLDAGEVTNTSYVCNGAAANVLADVDPEPAGNNCPNGGNRVRVGLDLDDDGVLDAGEVSSTSFVCSVRARVPFGITTASLPLAVPNTPYSVAIEAAGGIGSGFSWRLASGAVPAGFSLDATGTPATNLSGSPTSGGTFDFVVEVTDLVGNTATRAFSLEVGRPLSLATSSLPPFAESSAYSATLQAQGGSAPFTFAVVDSSLPGGLSLSSAGVLSGTPTERYGRRFIVEVTDASGDRVRGAYTLRGPRASFAYCGDVNTNNQADVILGRFGPTGTSTAVATPTVNGSPIDVSCFDVAFSPRSDRLAVVGDDGSGSNLLYIVDFGSFPSVSSIRVGFFPASSSNDVSDIVWSPDGRYVAYIGDLRTNGDSELFVADVSDLTAVTSTVVNRPLASSGDVFEARFTPDAGRLVYRADERVDGQNELFAFDLSSLTHLGAINGTLATSTDDVDNDWEISADSRWVLYAAEQDTASETELYVTRIDGATLGAPMKVNPAFVSGGDIGESNFPSDDDYGFSPAGDRIAYIADQETDGIGQVYVVRTSALGVSRLASTAQPASGQDVFDIEWDALGRRLLLRGDLTTGADNELYLADVFNLGADPVKVNDALAASGDVDTIYGFSPDGSFVFYEADQDVATEEELYVVASANVGTTGSSQRVLSGFATDSVGSVAVSEDGSGLFVVFDGNTTFSTDYEAAAATVSSGMVSPATRVNAAFMGTSQDVSTTQAIIAQNRFALYVSDEITNNDSQAFLYDLQTGTKVTLTPSVPASGDASTVLAQEL